ncbi:ricin-type beta-trefoil lectin domain protein [Streptomyces sp. NPDC059894]|uniref:ricin-type beta-trefoil lectin domain protein n=1 Tax=unclassified Streptomyces TaxID=2593676 RepID=UPI003654D6E9
MPGTEDRSPDAAGRGASVPRLSQISSLGARGTGGPHRDRHPDRLEPPVPAAPAATPGKGAKARREGLRGALGVVCAVGLLAVGSAVLTLGLVGGDDGDERAGSSGSVDFDADTFDGLGEGSTPSAQTSGADAGKKPDGSEKPTASASSTADASTSASASPGKDTTASPKAKAETKTSAAASVPGVGVYSHASRRCVDVVGGKAVQGAKLMISDCNQSASQHWTFTDGTMRSLGMCVQLAGGSTADGTDLELASCDGSPAQRFVLNVRNDLANSFSDKCGDVRDNGTANGTRLQLWSCSGGENQKWSTS